MTQSIETKIPDKIPTEEEINQAATEDLRAWVAELVMGYTGVGWYRRKSAYTQEWEGCQKEDTTVDAPQMKSSLCFTWKDKDLSSLHSVPNYFENAQQDYEVFSKIRTVFDNRFLHIFFDYLYRRLKSRNEFKHDRGEQDIRYIVSYRPGDFSYVALLTQIQRLGEMQKVAKGQNPYPVGERYPPPPPIPGLVIGPDEKICDICRGSGREQLTDLTIDVCMRCFGRGKVKVLKENEG